jgi:type IV pilus modification protein PilV
MMTMQKIKGFTLIEVMLALLILALGILGISKLQGTLVKNSSDANQRAVAIALAQKKIDDLRSYAEISLDGTTDWACPSGTPLSAASIAYADINQDRGGAPGCATDLIVNSDILIGNTNY